MIYKAATIHKVKWEGSFWPKRRRRKKRAVILPKVLKNFKKYEVNGWIARSPL